MKIDITDINLIVFTKEVYNLSSPQGFGFLHFEEGELTDEEAKEILDTWKNDKQFALEMDYIKGRSCKMVVLRDKDRLFIRTPWYDHTNSQLIKLLRKVLPERELAVLKQDPHNPSCNCKICQERRFLEEEVRVNNGKHTKRR